MEQIVTAYRTYKFSPKETLDGLLDNDMWIGLIAAGEIIELANKTSFTHTNFSNMGPGWTPATTFENMLTDETELTKLCMEYLENLQKTGSDTT